MVILNFKWTGGEALEAMILVNKILFALPLTVGLPAGPLSAVRGIGSGGCPSPISASIGARGLRMLCSSFECLRNFDHKTIYVTFCFLQPIIELLFLFKVLFLLKNLKRL